MRQFGDFPGVGDAEADELDATAAVVLNATNPAPRSTFLRVLRMTPSP